MCAKKTSTQSENLFFSSQFFSDLNFPDMVFGSFVRTKTSSGTIVNADTSILPEGYFYFDGRNEKIERNYSVNGKECPLFCDGNIKFAGQSAGIVLGPVKSIARQLASRMALEVKENDSSTQPQVIAQRNINYGKEYTPEEDDITVENTWETDISILNYSEPNGAICFEKDSRLYVYTHSLWIKDLRSNLSRVTGYDEADIVIYRTKLQTNNTSALWLNTITACQCAVAAIKLKRPVKLEFTREEQGIFAEKNTSITISHKTTVNKRSGLLKAMEINISADCGYYNPFTQEIADRLAISSTGIYYCPNVKIASKIYSSNSIPSSIDFNIIDSRAFFALENQINALIPHIDQDSLSFRKINKQGNSKNEIFPFKFESKNIDQALDAVCKKSIFLRKEASYKVTGDKRFSMDHTSPFAPPLRGISLACAYEGTGFAGSVFDIQKNSVELTVYPDLSLTVHAVPVSESIWQDWKKIISTSLNIPESSISADPSFSNKTEPENPQTSDASVTVSTMLIKKACDSLKPKISDNMATPVSIKKTLPPNIKKKWDSSSFSGTPFTSTAFAAMVLEVELDSCTYKEHIRGIWFIVDAGKILNPKAVEIDIRNSIQEALRELVENDEIEANEINIQFINSDEEPKPVGEVVYSLLPAVYSGAVSQAAGKIINHLPLKTDSIYNITVDVINEHKKNIQKLEEEFIQEKAQIDESTQENESK